MADVFTVLRQIRFRKGMTRGELAERAGIAQSYLSMIEHGKRPNVPLDTLTRIADALGCEVHIRFREKATT